MMTKSRWAVLLAALWLAVAQVADATMFVHRTFDAFVQEVDRIVVGEIVRVETRWEAAVDDSESIVTEAVLRVDRQVKGAEFQREIVLRSPGGHLDGFEQWVPGAPNVGGPGDRFVVFLWDDADDFMSNVAHWERGIFRIEEDGRVDGTDLTEDAFLLQVERKAQAHRGDES